jgi:hypothetical protein
MLAYPYRRRERKAAKRAAKAGIPTLHPRPANVQRPEAAE